MSAIDQAEFEVPRDEQKDFNCQMYWVFEFKLSISKLPVLQ